MESHWGLPLPLPLSLPLSPSLPLHLSRSLHLSLPLRALHQALRVLVRQCGLLDPPGPLSTRRPPSSAL